MFLYPVSLYASLYPVSLCITIPCIPMYPYTLYPYVSLYPVSLYPVFPETGLKGQPSSKPLSSAWKRPNTT